MLEMSPEHSYGGDAAVGEDRAVGWASRQRQGLRLMSLGEVWFGAATLAGSAYPEACQKENHEGL